MTEAKTYSEAEAHRLFAAMFFNQTWDLLDKPARTSDEDDQMIGLANASLTHWRKAGTGLHLQRGYWMLSHVHSVVGNAQPGLHYAKRCLELTEQHPDLMQDFDVAFAFEAMARASAVAGDADKAREFLQKAETAGKAIQDKDDRKVFDESLAGGNWHGVK